MNSSVKVPSKILGVLGGMGPAATAEFLRLLAIKAPARSDQEHPKLYVLSNPQIPDRSSAILGRGEDPTPFLKEGLLSLVQWGAQVLTVPCNTAHFFIDTFRKELPVPLIHIVETTVGLAAERSSEGAWLLATSGTKQSGMYERYAEKVGYPFFGELILDCLNRTEIAMTQDHAFLAAQLCLEAQDNAVRINVDHSNK